MAELYVNNSSFNNYTIRPKSISQLTSFRGVVDFSQIGRFNQFESGYSYLEVLQMPKFLTMCADKDTYFKDIYTSFRDLLENEFRGLNGLPDLESEAMEITDGINTQQMINKVTMNTSVEVSMSYYERQGGLITKFTEYYLTGIKDKNTQAKTYHGLIKNGRLEPDYENEVFTLLYIVTDNTMLRVEKAFLLANAQLTRAAFSDMYNSTRGTYENKEMEVTFRCFPITGAVVDALAKAVVEDISGVIVPDPNNMDKQGTLAHVKSPTGNKKKAVLDSTNFKYGIFEKSISDSTGGDTLARSYGGKEGLLDIADSSTNNTISAYYDPDNSKNH